MIAKRLFAIVGLVALGLALPAASAQQGDASAPPAAAAPAGAPAADGSADFNRELLTIEEEVHSLKEEVFRAKATLQLLKEIVVQGSSGGSRITVWHEVRLGRAYSVESINYFLDGQSKFGKVDPTGGLNQMREFKVMEEAVPPGQHNLAVNLRLRGNGFGLFSYLKEYAFTVRDAIAVTAEEGRNCTVRVIVDEAGGVGKSFTEKPAVKFDLQCVRLSDGGAGQP